MLRTTKLMKDKYEKIQKYLFSLIPEKWDEIYLYASVYQNKKMKKTGELYFYYLPKGILKKKPINVYEVPQKFNINEDEYLKVVQELYQCIKELHQDFIDTEQEIWTSITISIANYRFRAEYSYEHISRNEMENEARRVIWRYKYLGIGGEKKEERKILDEYFEKERYRSRRKEIYETGLYLKTENNEISFDKEEVKEAPIYEKEEKQDINPEYQRTKEIRKANENQEIKEKPKTKKNQILNDEIKEIRKSPKKNQILNFDDENV